MKHLFFNITQIVFATEGIILLLTPAWPIAYILALGSLVVPQPPDKPKLHQSFTKKIADSMIFNPISSIKDFFKKEATTVGKLIFYIFATIVYMTMIPIALIVTVELDVLFYIWDSLCIADSHITPLFTNMSNPITKILDIPIKL